MLKILFIRHLFLINRMSINLLRIWSRSGKWSLVLVTHCLRAGHELVLDVIKLLLVFKMRGHVVEVGDLVAELLQEIVFLLNATTVSATLLIGWVARVLLDSIT